MRLRAPLPTHPRTLLPAFAVGAALCAGAAHGAEAPGVEARGWTFSGFGSAGVVHSDYREADFTSSILKSEGSGASRAWSANLDSRIGGQLGVNIDKRWSAVVQVVLEQRYDLSYKPTVEWANVKYQVTPDLSLRLGRIALPIFLAADYRKIGYAFPWVRTPVEVYGGVPITNSDGADLAYRWRHAGVKHVTQAFFGNAHVSLTDTNKFTADDIVGVTHSAEIGATTLRATAFQARLDATVARPLFDGFRQFGPAGSAIADKYDVREKRYSGWALGINYDPGQWFIMAEGGATNGRSFLGRSVGAYISAGVRAGELTPYLTYSLTDARNATTDPGLPLAALPPAHAAAAAGLNAGLAVLLRTNPSQTSITAGVRWDLRQDMALKLQYDRVMPRAGSRGTLINLEPGFRSGRAVNVTSALLDFVF